MVQIRPMTVADVEGVRAVVRAADEDADARAGRDPEPVTDEQRARFRSGTLRFIAEDAGGAWVAVDGDRVVGMAEAIRRGGFWGLSMLFVDPAVQSKGVGRQLIDRTLEYADGAGERMIMASPDPRALRRYSRAGLAIHPAAEAEGTVDRAAIPADLPGRAGDASDLDLVTEVDAVLGRSRAADAAFLLDNGARIEVVDTGPGRGFAISVGAHVSMLGATDEPTAVALLWRALAAAEQKTSMYCLTAAQDWAVRVAFDARLKVVVQGALFISGRPHPPGPWIPSGWYF